MNFRTITIHDALPCAARAFAAVVAGACFLAGAGCGGLDDSIATTVRPMGTDEVWSATSPRIEMQSGTPFSIANYRSKIYPYSAELAVGSDSGVRPKVMVQGTEDGELFNQQLFLSFGTEGGFRPTSATFAPLADHPGYYEATDLDIPIEVRVNGKKHETAMTISPLLRCRDGKVQLRYSSPNVREGRFPAIGVPFILYDADANGIFDSSDVLVIDHNGDGFFDGNRNSVERYALFEPFDLGGHSYVVASVEWDGSRVQWGDSDVPAVPRDPLLVGERAPDFTLPDPGGNLLTFHEVRSGKPALLSYWATW
ncbi:MAG: hypothetical protein HKN20_08935 [Gemmatimonadetes bacterium]|nr:hypothetical protein [Gemmatimonadota bacterium]